MEPNLNQEVALVPVEQEEVKRKMAAAIDQARASLAHGEKIPHEGIMREFGLGR